MLVNESITHTRRENNDSEKCTIFYFIHCQYNYVAVAQLWLSILKCVCLRTDHTIH